MSVVAARFGSSRADPYACVYAIAPSRTTAIDALGAPVLASVSLTARSMSARTSAGSDAAAVPCAETRNATIDATIMVAAPAAISERMRRDYMTLWSLDDWKYIERAVVTARTGRQWCVGLMDILGQEGDPDMPNLTMELQFASGRY